MRVCCFYNQLDPRVASSLERFAPDCEYVNTTASQQTYAEELERRWTGTDDLVLVEQDKEIHGEVLPSFAACPEPWCGYTYWIDPIPHTALVLGGFGVTKFSAEIQQKVAVKDFAWTEWRGIDRRFNDLLLSMGIGCHLHGHVVHHHVYPSRPKMVRDHAFRLREAGLAAPQSYPDPLEAHLLPGSYDLIGKQ